MRTTFAATNTNAETTVNDQRLKLMRLVDANPGLSRFVLGPVVCLSLVLITVPLMAQPTAVSDSYVVTSEVPTPLDILANDIENGSAIDAMSITIVNGPQNGTVMFDAFTGDAVYTSNQGFSGGDSFTYKVSDFNGNESGTATVTITVLENLPPLIESFYVTKEVNGTHTFSGTVDDEQPQNLEFYVAGVLLPHSYIEFSIAAGADGAFSFSVDLEGETGDAIIHAIDSIGQMSNIASVEVED